MGTELLDRMFALEEKLLEKKQWMKEMVEQGLSEVANFYEGSVVFVTGGSGFLGKQLIEKLIRSCKVAKVYVLLRKKKNNTIQDRLQYMLNETPFDYLRKHQPTFATKIIPVEGDVGDLGVGISENNRTSITDQVNFIFHAAACTNFNMRLKPQTLINVRGTREVLSLAKACKQLRCMVYVSTAYSQAIDSRLKESVLEKFYDCPVSVHAMIQLAEVVNEDRLDGFMDIYRKEWPNSYTFTKSLAEEIVRNSGDLPVCVVRPAIVVSSDREPAPGWLDNNAIFSASGLLLGLELGLIHVFYNDMKIKADFVPVDFTNNAIIAAAKETAKRYTTGEKEKKIYAVTCIRNPSDKGLFPSFLRNEMEQLPSVHTIYHRFAYSITNKTLFTILNWTIHYIPAVLVDMVLAITGNKLRLLKIYKKAYNMSLSFDHFDKKQWRLDDSNTQNLFENMSPIDKNIFCFDIATIKWRDFTRQWFYGITKYIMRDDFKNIAYAKKKQFLLKILHYVLCSAYFYLLYKGTKTFVMCLRCLYYLLF